VVDYTRYQITIGVPKHVEEGDWGRVRLFLRSEILLVYERVWVNLLLYRRVVLNSSLLRVAPTGEHPR
jgi:hypothetical protein